MDSAQGFRSFRKMETSARLLAEKRILSLRDADSREIQMPS